MTGIDDDRTSNVAAEPSERFAPELMFGAATLYYEQNATQAEAAVQLGTSRATVSRLLAEARRRGIVRIEVVPPVAPATGVAADLVAALELEAAYVEPTELRRPDAPLASALAAALGEARMQPGEVLLVSSGRTVYEAARGQLPRLPGVVVVPTLGGQEEPEPWFQTNEVTRAVAAKIGGRPVFLYAPALPSPELYASLIDEPSIKRVIGLWESAACAIVGIGSPLLTRSSIPTHLPSTEPALNRAIGDISSRFYLRDGEPVAYPGDERLLAISLEWLRSVPVSIGVAYGEAKVGAVTAAARAGYIRRLATDEPTAIALLQHAERG